MRIQNLARGAHDLTINSNEIFGGTQIRGYKLGRTLQTANPRAADYAIPYQIVSVYDDASQIIAADFYAGRNKVVFNSEPIHITVYESSFEKVVGFFDLAVVPNAGFAFDPRLMTHVTDGRNFLSAVCNSDGIWSVTEDELGPYVSRDIVGQASAQNYAEGRLMIHNHAQGKIDVLCDWSGARAALDVWCERRNIRLQPQAQLIT